MDSINDQNLYGLGTSQEQIVMTKAECLLQETIDKEMHYLKCLQSLKYGVVQPLIDKIAYGATILTKQEIEELFSKNLESFLSLSQLLLVEFLKVKELGDIEATGTIFIQQAEWFKCYKEYVTVLPQRLEFLSKLKANSPQFRAFLIDAGGFLRKVGISDDLESLLMKPARVIVSYHEFLQGLEETHKKKKTDRIQQGLQKVAEILALLDLQTELSNEIEFKKVQQLNKRVRGRVNFADSNRIILYEATFLLYEMDPVSKSIVKPSKPVHRHVVLFNDAFLVAIPYQKSDLVMERYLPLTEISGEIFLNGDSDNSILKVVTFGYTYYFGCPDQIERDLWLSTLHRALVLYEAAPKRVYRTSSRESDVSKGQPKLNEKQKKLEDDEEPLKSPLNQVKKRAMWRRGVVNTDGIRQTMNISSSTHLILEVVSKYVKAMEKFRDMDPIETIPFFVGTSGAVIGRNIASNDHRGQILINDDTGMSRVHAEIEYDYTDKRFSVRDLGSANNTIIISGILNVDGQEVPVENKAIGHKGKVGKWFTLKENTIFQLGGTRFKVTRVSIKTEDVEHPDPFAASKQTTISKKDPAEKPRLQTEQTVILPSGVDTPITNLWDEPKRVVVAIRRGTKQRLVGAVLVEQGQTWAQVRKKIFEGLVRSSSNKSTYQLSSMSLFLNGTIPIPESQDEEQVYGFIENRDQFVVEINAPKKV
eukprot:TRINITY_DN11093_c0_g1_i1.p1 TRINITY_DN11093_c0_g1~~TRINITY_DN11093_c0_g1_i1.p1  ORF type:complete len:704 (-),score=128.61 TRINITY_DN11093_c0_g1_i1:45-2156(-)